jgi:hypothetical protein
VAFCSHFSPAPERSSSVLANKWLPDSDREGRWHVNPACFNRKNTGALPGTRLFAEITLQGMARPDY